MPAPQYPEISIPGDVGGGNIYAVTGRAIGEMRRAGVPPGDIEEMETAISASQSYEAALDAIRFWIDIY